MCTVTILPRRDGLRLLTNRDESRERSPALPPEARIVPGAEPSLRAVYPLDADAGGTWVAVNTAGVVLTLLNRNLPPPRGGGGDGEPAPPADRRSRGEIIPHLLDCRSAAEAHARLTELNPRRYAAFRLVVSDAERVVVARTDTMSMARDELPLGGTPWMFTSSGLGDHIVDPPRRGLFNDWFRGDRAAWAAEQDAFHRHRWADRPELSVCMSREDARTVSLTSVEMDSSAVRMVYHAGPPCEPAEDHQVELPR